MKPRSFLFSIFLFSFLFLAFGIRFLAVTDPVESNYALTAWEMVQHQDWLSPQIYGTYWYDKPIFLYWLLALSYSLLGVSDFAARLPAVLFGAASSTLAAWFCLRQTGKKSTALLLAVMTLTTLAGWFIARSVITDEMLFFFTAASLFLAYIGLCEKKKAYVILAYAMAGLAVLTKGPVGLILPGTFLLVFALIRRNRAYLKALFPPLGILLFLLICLSWYGPMYYRHGQAFLDGLLGFNNVVRATVSEHPEQDVWYYYLVIIPAGLLPWSGPALYGLWQKRSFSDSYVFLAVWALGTLLFYTLMATKYPTYTYIANLPLLYLGALTITDWLESKRRRPWLWLVLPTLFYWLLFIVATTFAAQAPFPLPSLWTLVLLLTIMSLLVLIAYWQKAFPALPLLVSLGTMTLYLLLTVQVLIPFYAYRSTQSLQAVIPPGPVYFFEEYRTSYNYYTGRQAIWTAPDSYVEQLQKKRDSVWNKKYLYPQEGEESVLNRLQKGEKLTLIVPRGNYEDYQKSRFAPYLKAQGYWGAYYVFSRKE